MSKKYLALLLCALLMLGAAGCLEKTEKAEAGIPPVTAEATASAAGDTGTSETDALPAFTLGDLTVTVGEVRNSYNSLVEYMGYYGLTAPSTAEEIGQYRDMIIEDLLSAKVLPWKAKELGIELTEEKRAQVAQEVEELIAEYAGDYLDQAKADLGESAGAAELALKAREYLEKDVEDYFGYPFAQWLAEVTASYEEGALTELLQEKFNQGVTATEEQAKTWFETELANQKESFEADYTAFKSQLEAYQLGESDVPALFTPEGFGRMQVISFDADADNSAAYSANELEMTTLEAEYGKLVLRGQDEARQAEIQTRYQELQAQNEDLLQKNSEKAQKVRANALDGMDFAELFNTYSAQEGSMSFFGYAEGDPKRDGTVVFYTKAQDTDWPEDVWKAAIALKEGEVSELLQVGDTFYVIKRLSDLPAGAAAFADDPDTYTAAAVADMQTEEWEAIQADWLSEARNAAVFYEENYAGVGAK